MVQDAEPRWLNDRERGAWMRLTAILELLPSAIDSQLRRDSSLTYTEYYSLAMISETETRRIQMKRLATLTNTTLPRLSRVISGLEKVGYVERQPNAHDARATDVVLTDIGMAALVEAAPEHVSKVRETVFDPIREDQVQHLIDIADSWLDVLDPERKLARGPESWPDNDSSE